MKKCNHCQTTLKKVLLDLGSAPPSNAYLTEITLSRPEKWFPLKVLVCEKCWLVQAEPYSRAAELFNDEYAYFSSFSKIWLEHASKYTEMIVKKLSLNRKSFVVEIASNDGYLLQNMVKRGIPCMGIEPTASTASASRQKGINTLEKFFGTELASELAEKGQKADLMIANNVLAHVPHINDFVKAFKILLKEDGVATFEFPHLLRLIQEKQFDTIYHEHFSYLSFSTVKNIFEECGLKAFDVEELETHGGSLRVYVCKSTSKKYKEHVSVQKMVKLEMKEGMHDGKLYDGFQNFAENIKQDLLEFLIKAKKQKKTVIGYGAAAKGNTLINFSGIKKDLVSCVVDLNPHKQGKFLPGSRIPIVGVEVIEKLKPDYILVFPWNIKSEIVKQLSFTKKWKCKFVTAIPSLQVI